MYGKKYKSKKAGQLLLWVLKKKQLNEWVTKSTAEFSVLVLITFFLTTDILGLAILDYS